jgi:hypothetical protein
MAPPKYKDLGKKANDILNEEFKFEQTFEVESKSAIYFDSAKCILSDKGKGLTGKFEGKKSVSSVGDVTIKVDHELADPSITIENR